MKILILYYLEQIQNKKKDIVNLNTGAKFNHFLRVESQQEGTMNPKPRKTKLIMMNRLSTASKCFVGNDTTCKEKLSTLK
uniref:Uncharacterized protein n=1 Tax=Octopus bimaculoides TaxID=37653 RepID=A0A0L8FT33_OCTBM